MKGKADVLVAAFACVALACGGHGDGARAPAPAPVASAGDPSHPVDRAAPGAKTSGRSIALQLAFDAGRLRVRIAATGPAAELRAWQLGEDAVDHLEVRDGSERALRFERKGRDVEIAGAGGSVSLAYDVLSSSPAKQAVTFESAEAMDAAAREASHGARSLDDVVRALAKQAEERRRALPENALRELVGHEAGPRFPTQAGARGGGVPQARAAALRGRAAGRTHGAVLRQPT